MSAVAESKVAQLPAQADQFAVMERVLLAGDLSRLTEKDRVLYYNSVCQSVGLNPLTRPFDYMALNGKTVLYAKRECTEQLRKIYRVSIEKLERDTIEGCYVVTAYARDKDGRTDSSTGAVSIGGLKGEAMANAMMKAETKAKRRVTLSICGLGLLDESEIDSVPTAAPQTTAPALTAEQQASADAALTNLKVAAARGSKMLQIAWEAITKDERKALSAYLPALKQTAEGFDYAGEPGPTEQTT